MNAWKRMSTIMLALTVAGGAMAMYPLDGKYVFFPDRNLHATPEAVGLAYQDVNFEAADGVRLHGWLVPGESDRPLVLFAHGNAGNISHRLDNLLTLHRLGLSVFIFDYRGYGQSAGEMSEKGSYADMRGALAWLKANGWTPERLIYFGRSLGGAVAMQLALEQPPAGLVLESAFTSIARMGWHHQPVTYALFGWWALASRYDNLGKIGRLQCPLLMFQGTRDGVVPRHMAEQLFARAPEPKTLYLITGAGHNDTCEIGGQPYWDQWRTFLARLAVAGR